MTIKYRLQRLERIVEPPRGDSPAWIRELSDDELDARIAQARAAVGETERMRCEQAIQAGPDAMRAYLDG